MPLEHQPVLYQEIIHALQPKSEGRYVDGTLGAGGHAHGILHESGPDGLLLGLDVDPHALKIAQNNLAAFNDRIFIRQASYTTLKQQLESLDWDYVDGILLDLGASSMQFDNPQRGFSFLRDGPLDMRFDPAGTIDAYQIVNEWSEKELIESFFKYGQESASRKIAHAIVASRPITRTYQLAQIIEDVIPRKKSRHPATRIFQALRIVVNNELESIKMTLPIAIQVLTPGARLAVISFHSLEEHIVKDVFRRESQGCICSKHQPICTCDHKASVREINRSAIKPSDKEIKANNRARSARLRIVEKI